MAPQSRPRTVTGPVSSIKDLAKRHAGEQATVDKTRMLTKGRQQVGRKLRARQVRRFVDHLRHDEEGDHDDIAWTDDEGDLGHVLLEHLGWRDEAADPSEEEWLVSWWSKRGPFVGWLKINLGKWWREFDKKDKDRAVNGKKAETGDARERPATGQSPTIADEQEIGRDTPTGTIQQGQSAGPTDDLHVAAPLQTRLEQTTSVTASSPLCSGLNETLATASTPAVFTPTATAAAPVSERRSLPAPRVSAAAPAAPIFVQPTTTPAGPAVRPAMAMTSGSDERQSMLLAGLIPRPSPRPQRFDPIIPIETLSLVPRSTDILTRDNIPSVNVVEQNPTSSETDTVVTKEPMEDVAGAAWGIITNGDKQGFLN